MSILSCGGGSDSLPQADQTGPVVVSVEPAENQLDVLETDSIRIQFNEAIDETTIQVSSSIVIKKIDGAQPITLDAPISSYAYVANTNTLTFTPKGSALKVNSRYQILVRNIVDTAGNMMADKTWEFETISNPGGTINPRNGTLGASPASTITVVFTKPMDISSLMVIDQATNEQNPINFILTEASVVIPNKNILFSYNSQSNTASYSLKTTTPNQYGFKISTTYQAVLSNLAMGLNGIRLTKDISTSFVTGVNKGIGARPAGPSTVSATAKNSTATILWDAVSGNAISYNVYVSNDGGVNFESIFTNIQGTVQATNKLSIDFTIVAGKPYLFAVTAVQADVESLFTIASETVLVTIVAKPTGVLLKISTTNTGLSTAIIEWNYISNIKYNLLMSVDGAAFTLVGAGGITGPVVGVTPNQKIQFTHNIVTDKSHQYQIVAVNSQGIKSAPALTRVKTPTLLTAPPVSVKAIIGDAEMTVSFEAPYLPNSNTQKYSGLKFNVYLLKKTKLTKIASNLLSLNFYQRISNNASYDIAVTAVDAAGLESIKVFATDKNNSRSFIPLASGKRIDASDNTCFIRDNGKKQNAGSLWCWGINNAGQLGIGKRSTMESVVQVGTVPVGKGIPEQLWDDWIAVSTGFGTSCGIRKPNGIGPGLLYCWGNNPRGNLGLGSLPAGTNTAYPQLVLKPKSLGATPVNWTKVSVGEQGHTCAIHSDANTVGELFCWGNNFYGQLGNTLDGKTAPDVAQPEPVAGANSTLSPYKDWIEVSLGNYRTCGIRQESPDVTTAWCWGNGAAGAIGSNNLRPVNIPTQEETLGNDWTSITMGSFHSCAIKTNNNTLWCWGRNFNGSLGTGNSQASIVAVQEVTLAQDWIKVFANFDTTCGLKSNGKVSCWGKNRHGQTGNALSQQGDNTPKISIANSDWSDIVVGRNHSCGLTLSNNALCWGGGENYKLGNLRVASAIPVTAKHASRAQLSNISEIDASIYSVPGGGSHIIATDNAVNKLYSWGNNINFQVTGKLANVPNYQSAIEVDTRLWKNLNAGEGYSCAILVSDNTLWCWGKENLSTATRALLKPTQIGVDKWRMISITGRQNCGIKLVVDAFGVPQLGDKSLWCWGRENVNGQLGIGNNTSVFSKPTQPVISPLATAVDWLAVSAGNFNTCAITTTNDLYCWGRTASNLLGVAGAAELHQPTTALTVSATITENWTDVQLGKSVACSVTDTKKLYCWGGLQVTPTLVTAGSGIWSAFDVGQLHVCAIDAVDSSLWCWGDNRFGQLGTGQFDNLLNVPATQVRVQNKVASWAKIAAGDSYTCAVRTDVPTTSNGLWCWGKNTHGELANFNAWKLKPVPVAIP